MPTQFHAWYWVHQNTEFIRALKICEEHQIKKCVLHAYDAQKKTENAYMFTDGTLQHRSSVGFIKIVTATYKAST